MKKQDLNPGLFLRMLSGMLLAGPAILLIQAWAQAAVHNVESGADTAVHHLMHGGQALALHSENAEFAAAHDAHERAHAGRFIAHFDSHEADQLESVVAHASMHAHPEIDVADDEHLHDDQHFDVI